MQRLARRTFLVTGSTTLAGVSGCLSTGGSPERLTVGILPDVDPETAIETNQPLAEALERDLEIEVDLETTSDYASLVQSMDSEQIDLAYFGGVSYVLASQRTDARAIAVGKRDGETDWESVFIAHEASGIDTETALAEGPDIEFVLGDPISTTGSVMPTYYADVELGIDLETAFESTTHLGAHDAILRTVRDGNAAAGALNGRIYDAQAAAGDTDGAVEIWRTPAFANYPWTVGPTVDDELAGRIQDSFTTLHTRVDDDLLEQLNVDRYVETGHEAFTDLEEAVDLMGISEV